MKSPGKVGEGRSKQKYEEKSLSTLLSKQVFTECLLCSQARNCGKQYGIQILPSKILRASFLWHTGLRVLESKHLKTLILCVLKL